MSDTDRKMTDLLVKFEMVSHGSITAYNGAGASTGHPDDKVIMQVLRKDVPPHVLWRIRYERSSVTGRPQIYTAAKEEYDSWTNRSNETRAAAEAAEDRTLEEFILEDGRGKSAEVLARQFNVHPDLVRRIRQKAKVSTETGLTLLSAAPVDDKPAKALELSRHGMSTREIGTVLDVHQTQVMRWIRKGA